MVALLNDFSIYDIIVERNSIFAQLQEQSHNDDILPNITACVENDIVTVISLNYPQPPSKLPVIESFLETYGVPDKVTWFKGIPALRIAFWFEQGLAISIFMYNDSIYAKHIIYFAPQQLDVFEDNYPYNHTWSPETEALEEIYGEQNPFDFDSIVESITLTPELTVTPAP